MTDKGIDSRSIGLRAQKKLLSKMSSKKMAKVFIDDTSGRLLDNMFKLIKKYTGNKKTAEKVLKNIIKIVVKIGILYRNDQFTKQELAITQQFMRKFRSTVMTAISFYEVDFTFDQFFLSKNLQECQAMLQSLIDNHLTDKSKDRVDMVFGFFSDVVFLQTIFQSDSDYRKLLGLMVDDLHTLMDNGTL
ncbi:unnamed protein product [Owenia fusiformis]|uniref:Uncharacterized protein n=1 Tax=Owenia fusiformis TaxID=6347 RepID=A0A8J1XUA8_OWEFU|nr:unnamed protein product [Owenia fusiformis]